MPTKYPMSQEKGSVLSIDVTGQEKCVLAALWHLLRKIWGVHSKPSPVAEKKNPTTNKFIEATSQKATEKQEALNKWLVQEAEVR